MPARQEPEDGCVDEEVEAAAATPSGADEVRHAEAGSTTTDDDGYVPL